MYRKFLNELEKWEENSVQEPLLVIGARQVGKTWIGTINLDYRSLYHHFECATYLYQTRCIADIEKDFEDTLEKCNRVTEQTIKGEKRTYKMAGGFMKVIAPLM
jgi:cardiolipin synthase